MSRFRDPAHGAWLYGFKGWLMAEYLIDVNLPRFLSHWIGDNYRYVVDLSATWTDIQIWNYASIHGLTIVSKDTDFSNRVFVESGGPGVIHLRIGNMKFAEMEAFFIGRWAEVCALSAQHQLVQVYRDRVECIT